MKLVEKSRTWMISLGLSAGREEKSLRAEPQHPPPFTDWEEENLAKESSSLCFLR